MNCMICGAPLQTWDYCVNCGANVRAQKEAIRMSDLLYNQGLEKAQIRDLSGAVGCLSRSVKLNKLNVPARNLLGLVYYEMGEVVAALSEWVISKNILEEGNLATEYIQRLQAHANKLDAINQSIKKYNLCLLYCRQGNEDMAILQLKKVIAQNPKLIKGYQLLALLYMKEKNYEKARKLLKTAARIDRTNTTTLRFLREVDEQTGKMTSLEPRFRAKAKAGEESRDTMVYQSGNDVVIQPPAFRESSALATLLNLGFGLVIGAAALWFLVVPAMEQRVNQEANQKVVEYSDQVASQAAEISRLESSMSESEATVNSANEQVAQAGEQSASYENLLKAYSAIQDENYTTAANAMQGVNAELLSVEARELYDSIFSQVRSTLVKGYYSDGIKAYEAQDYETAIASLLKAYEMDNEDYDIMYYLAHSYFESGDTGNADIYFQRIIDTQPGTRRASDAKDYMTGTPSSAGTQGEENAGNEEEISGENGGVLAGAGASADSGANEEDTGETEESEE